MSEIKAVVFDWGGVLIDNPIPDLMRYCSHQLGIPVSQMECAQQKFDFPFARGEMSECDVWKLVGKGSVGLWKEAFAKVYTLQPDVVQIARFLKSSGYRIGLLSNTELPSVEFLNENPFDCVDHTVFSCDLGCTKPDVRMYNAMLTKLSLMPSEVLFVDDLVRNVHGAMAVGMRGIHYQGYYQLVNELRNQGIMIF